MTSSSWPECGRTVYQEEETDLYSLPRLGTDMAAKGQSGWELCDDHDRKYVVR